MSSDILFPHIAFIIFYLILFKKGDVFFLKRFFAVVFFFIGDIFNYGFHFRWSNLKCTGLLWPKFGKLP